MSLDDFLNSPDSGPQEDSLRVCLAGKLLPLVKAAIDEMTEIEAAVNRDPKVRDALGALIAADKAQREDGESAAPKKMGQSVKRLQDKYDALYESTLATWPGYAEKRAKLEDLNARMRKLEGVLTIKAHDEGEWLRFMAENPPRRESVVTKDKDGNEVSQDRMNLDDLELTRGKCDADALRLALPTYVHTFNGEHVPPEKAEKLIAGISAGDRRDLVQMVVKMQEFGTDPKALSDLLESLPSGTA